MELNQCPRIALGLCNSIRHIDAQTPLFLLTLQIFPLLFILHCVKAHSNIMIQLIPINIKAVFRHRTPSSLLYCGDCLSSLNDVHSMSSFSRLFSGVFFSNLTLSVQSFWYRSSPVPKWMFLFFLSVASLRRLTWWRISLIRSGNTRLDIEPLVLFSPQMLGT